MPLDDDELNEILDELVKDGSIIEYQGKFYARGMEPEEARKAAGPDERTYLLFGGHLDGGKIVLPRDTSAYLAFLGLRWSVYRRRGTDRLIHAGYAATRGEAETLISD